MDLSAFRDPALARDLVASIQKLAPERDTYLMEVCGTHTVAIARGGLASILPDKVHLISMPSSLSPGPRESSSPRSAT